jgi:hypothetical protein
MDSHPDETLRYRVQAGWHPWPRTVLFSVTIEGGACAAARFDLT